MSTGGIKAQALREAACRLWADEKVQGIETTNRNNADYALWLMSIANEIEGVEQ